MSAMARRDRYVAGNTCLRGGRRLEGKYPVSFDLCGKGGDRRTDNEEQALCGCRRIDTMRSHARHYRRDKVNIEDRVNVDQVKDDADG